MTTSEHRPILHIITGLGRGGTEVNFTRLLRSSEWLRESSAVLVLGEAATLTPEVAALGIPVFTTCGPHVRRPSVAMRLARALRIARELRPDLLCGWMYHGNLAASVASVRRGSGARVVWNVRSSLGSLRTERLATRALIKVVSPAASHTCATIIYNSQQARRDHERIGYARLPGVVIPNGFEIPESQHRLPTSMALRGSLGIPLNAKVVAHVARFHPVKDHSLAFRTCVAVARAQEQTYCVFAGDRVTMDDPQLSRQVPPELRSRFLLLGDVADGQSLFAMADVALSTSIAEGFATVLGEAMAWGTPCVSTDVGDARHIVGDTGFVCEGRDPDALGEGILRFLNEPWDAGEERRRRARTHIEQHFGLPTVTLRYAQALRSLCGAQQARLAAAGRRP